MITASRNRKYRRFLCLTLLLLLILSLLAGCGKQTSEPETPITSISDLNGKIAVMQTGTVYSALLKARDDLPDLEITYSLSQTDALAMLLGFVAYGLSIFLYVKAQYFLGAAKTSAYYAAAPFVGSFLCFLLLGEKLNGAYFLGLFIMIAGTAFVVTDTLDRRSGSENPKHK